MERLLDFEFETAMILYHTAADSLDFGSNGIHFNSTESHSGSLGAARMWDVMNIADTFQQLQHHGDEIQCGTEGGIREVYYRTSLKRHQTDDVK